MSTPRSAFLSTAIERGFVHQCTDIETLDQRLHDGRVIGYIAHDCTADSLHVGHLMSIMLPRLLQNSATAPIVTKVRPALTAAGGQSGTRNRKTRRWRETGRAGSATRRARPFSACDMPAKASAILSASMRSAGVLAGNAISRRTPAS
jgi:hypothetical protein